MLTEAKHAQLVVVGSRGLGGFTGLLVGSISSHLATHATCPVVVIRPAHALRTSRNSERPICVVGIDDPTTADDILGFAFAEASRLRVGLTLVHCVEPTAALKGARQRKGRRYGRAPPSRRRRHGLAAQVSGGPSLTRDWSRHHRPGLS